MRVLKWIAGWIKWHIFYKTEYHVYTDGKMPEILVSRKPCDQADLNIIRDLASRGYPLAKMMVKDLDEKGFIWLFDYRVMANYYRGLDND